VRLRSAANGNLMASIPAHSGRVWGVRLDPHGGRLASDGADRQLRIWDLSDGSCLASFPNHYTRSNAAFAWSRDGRWLADTMPGMFRIIDADRLEEVRRLPLDPVEPISISFSRHGEYIAAIARDRPIRIWSRAGDLLT